MTEYTDPAAMPEDERMAPIELKAVREWLAVSGDWLAAHLSVSSRTVRHWEEGKYPIPDGVRVEVERLEDVTGEIVGMNVAALLSENDPAVATYRTDEAYWETVPEGGVRWPASWHRRVVMRVAQEVPDLTILEAGG